MEFKKNILSNIVTNGFSILVGFLTSMLIARGLGTYNQGTFSFFLLIFGLVATYGHFGISNSTSYFVKKSKYDKDDVLSTNFNSLVFFCLLYELFFLLFGKKIFGTDNSLLLIIWIVYLAMVILNNFFLTTYISNEKMYKYNRYTIITNIIKIIVVVSLYFTNNISIFYLSILYLVIEIIKNIFMALEVDFKYKFTIDFNIVKDEFKYGIPLCLAAFCIYLNYRVDQIMIKYFIGNSDLGIYSIAVQLAELGFLFPESIKSAFEGRLYKCDENQRKRLCEQVVKFTFYVTILICIIGCLCRPLINVFYGNEYDAAGLVMVVLLIGVTFASIGKVTPMYYFTSGRPKIQFYVSLSVLIINLIANFILIPILGTLGAALASTISYIFLGVIYIVLLVKNDKLSFRKLVIFEKNDIKKFIKFFFNRDYKERI